MWKINADETFVARVCDDGSILSDTEEVDGQAAVLLQEPVTAESPGEAAGPGGPLFTLAGLEGELSVPAVCCQRSIRERRCHTEEMWCLCCLYIVKIHKEQHISINIHHV